MLRLFAVLLALIGAGGCTWTPLRSVGEPVAIVGADTERCEAIGNTTARTTSHIGPFLRSPRKVRGELETLARNEAGAMGGDAIRALADPVDGEQRFEVLRCTPGSS